MLGKRLQFDDETWQTIEAVARHTDRSLPTRLSLTS